MKTLTEFPAMNLKNAAKVKQDLTASGKTPEELPQAMGEALKLEGDRLSFLLNALEIVGTQLQDLKRTVVYSFTEGDNAPQGAVQKGEHYYLVEYFPSLEKKGPQKDAKGPHASDDKRKGKRGGKGRDRNQGRGDRSKGRPQPKTATEK